MELAISHARRGFGHTFPNPAVGCVLVNQDTGNVIGAGYHPRAGSPHAEIFALLEACGHVSDGVAAADSVMNANPELSSRVQELSETYTSQDGPQKLFGCALSEIPVTAYVTLEPCCHFGKTPPCASSLVLAGVNKAVVGFRDPNPRVDGGGVQLLTDAGVDVVLMDDEASAACARLVSCFVKRISPRENDYSKITGAMRAALRSLAGRLKTENKSVEQAWPSKGPSVEGVEDLTTAISNLYLDPSWLENIDSLLWSKELVLLRLNNAVKKKRGTKLLGNRIATELDAHVAQVVGHTVLLYRPGIPPVLDLEQMVEDRRSKGSEDD